MSIQGFYFYFRVCVVVTTFMCVGLASKSVKAGAYDDLPILDDKAIEHLLSNPDGNYSWPLEFTLVPVFQGTAPVMVRKKETLSVYSLWHNRKKGLYLATRKQVEQLNREFMTLYFDPGQEGYYTDEQGWVNQRTGEFIYS